MNQVMPALEVMWVLLKFGLPFVLALGLLTWGARWLESKRSGARPTRERKRRRGPSVKRVEAGRQAREKGLAFEAELTRLFQAAGWKVEGTPLSGDHGVDLIVQYDTRRYAIQAKDHRNKVGADAVSAVYSGKDCYGCDTAILIAPGGVTDVARTKADKLGVLIWGKQDLVRLQDAAAGKLPVR